MVNSKAKAKTKAQSTQSTQSTTQITVLVDTREPETIISELQDKFNVVVTTLQHGDMLVPQYDIVIERKTANDLIDSIKDGRLLNQCYNLARHKYRFLLIQGFIGHNRNSLVVADRFVCNMTYAALDGVLRTVQSFGVIITRCYYHELAEHLMRLIAWCKKTHYIKPRTEFRIVQDSRLDFLAALPGVGYDKAQKVFEY